MSSVVVCSQMWMLELSVSMRNVLLTLRTYKKQANNLFLQDFSLRKREYENEKVQNQRFFLCIHEKFLWLSETFLRELFLK